MGRRDEMRGGRGGGVPEGKVEARQGYEIFQEPPTGWFPTDAVAQLWLPGRWFLAAKETLFLFLEKEREKERTRESSLERLSARFSFPLFFFLFSYNSPTFP